MFGYPSKSEEKNAKPDTIEIISRTSNRGCLFFFDFQRLPNFNKVEELKPICGSVLSSHRRLWRQRLRLHKENEKQIQTNL